jgi:hypothetical protein
MGCYREHERDNYCPAGNFQTISVKCWVADCLLWPTLRLRGGP